MHSRGRARGVERTRCSTSARRRCDGGAIAVDEAPSPAKPRDAVRSVCAAERQRQWSVARLGTRPARPWTTPARAALSLKHAACRWSKRRRGDADALRLPPRRHRRRGCARRRTPAHSHARVGGDGGERRGRRSTHRRGHWRAQRHAACRWRTLFLAPRCAAPFCAVAARRRRGTPSATRSQLRGQTARQGSRRRRLAAASRRGGGDGSLPAARCRRRSRRRHRRW